MGPLRQKSRQFIARNLELSARNRELEAASVSSSSSARRERTEQTRSREAGSRGSSANRKLRTRIQLGKVGFTNCFLL